MEAVARRLGHDSRGASREFLTASHFQGTGLPRRGGVPLTQQVEVVPGSDAIDLEYFFPALTGDGDEVVTGVIRIERGFVIHRLERIDVTQ